MHPNEFPFLIISSALGVIALSLGLISKASIDIARVLTELLDETKNN